VTTTTGREPSNSGHQFGVRQVAPGRAVKLEQRRQLADDGRSRDDYLRYRIPFVPALIAGNGETTDTFENFGTAGAGEST
jgi:hypothetical protein